MARRPILVIIGSSAALVAAAWGIWWLSGMSSDVLNGLMIFSGVVISAAVGFTGLIINSNQQDRLRREAINEQREHERITLAAALAGEARSNRAHVIGIARPAGRRADQGLATNFRWPEGSSVIFKANAGSVGLLGPELAVLLTELYGKLDLWRQFNHMGIDEIDAQGMKVIVEQIERHDIVKWAQLFTALFKIAEIEQPDSADEGENTE